MLKRAAIAVLLAAQVAAAETRVVALAPFSTLGAEDRSASTRKLLGQIEQALAALPQTKVVTAASERLTIDGIVFELDHWAPAHTSGGLVVYHPAQKVLFTGEVIAANRPDRVIHLEKHGSSAGWVTSVQGI